MRREGLWSQAKTRAAAVIKGVHPGDTVAIYAFDRGLRPVLGFQEWTTSSPGDRAALAQRKIDELKPGGVERSLVEPSSGHRSCLKNLAHLLVRWDPVALS